MAASVVDTTLDVEAARAHFPALKDGYIFADNAGGSQCLKGVVDRISDYLLHTNVQLGAGYTVSVSSTARVNEGATATAELLNALSPDEIVFASSSTAAVNNLAAAVAADILDGEEIIVTGEHEANAGPWKRLAAQRRLPLKVWEHTPSPSQPNEPYAIELALATLLPLITAKTRLVAFTACSNLLGTVVDVAAVIRAVRAEAERHGARKLEVCVDCVAYAPHRRIDVQAWDVDYCFFSYYKVYGPHISVLYARSRALAGLPSLAHHFLRVGAQAYKVSPGGTGYELAYASAGVLPYLRALSPAGAVDDAFARIATHEHVLLRTLLAYLSGADARARGVRIVGDSEAGPRRAPTVSFVVVGERAVRSSDIVAYFDKKGKMGIRYGHFYAYGLVDSLRPKIDLEDAIVRISLVHYNTVAEVDTLVDVLKDALDALQ
ncbi:hypothetical protein EW145_g7214 [Phellinidium pouzarii]|uniref:Aminotransferase class V domain-containing protein n=1 Tax=Phellinidium pouzarii TaxID=167371 RepID=A0A4S4KMH9_9AGAM|nr:hypothetical protein EW145_g7214 [Phellinidium pouzarii]